MRMSRRLIRRSLVSVIRNSVLLARADSSARQPTRRWGRNLLQQAAFGDTLYASTRQNPDACRQSRRDSSHASCSRPDTKDAVTMRSTKGLPLALALAGLVPFTGSLTGCALTEDDVVNPREPMSADALPLGAERGPV